MSTTTDALHGRQGGNFLPDDYEPLNLLLAKHCKSCDLPMVAGQWDYHHLCRTTTVGRRCSCPPRCTDTHVGDQGRCDPTCEPCRLHRGKEHDEIPEWKRTRKTADTVDDTNPEQLTLGGTQ